MIQSLYKIVIELYQNLTSGHVHMLPYRRSTPVLSGECGVSPLRPKVACGPSQPLIPLLQPVGDLGFLSLPGGTVDHTAESLLRQILLHDELLRPAVRVEATGETAVNHGQDRV